MSSAGSIPSGLSERYIRFADNEAQGRSPLYEALARGVAHDAEVIDFLSALPTAKQQPNLLFAAVRSLMLSRSMLAYVSDQEERQNFSDTVMSLSPYWICNESPRVLPDLSDSIGQPNQAGRFLLSVNRKPVAWTEPHGAAIEWIAPEKAIS